MARTALQNVFDPTIDHRAEIHKAIGAIDDFEIANNEVLVAIYKRPEMTKGGIALPEQVTREDLYQSKVGLVLKIGAACRFVRQNTAGVPFGLEIQLDDWIVFRPSDTQSLAVNGVDCRLVYDNMIRGRIQRPEMVW